MGIPSAAPSSAGPLPGESLDALVAGDPSGLAAVMAAAPA